jgi:hypothetical protein
MLTVVTCADRPVNERIAVRPKDGIARPIREKKPTAKPKTVVGMV